MKYLHSLGLLICFALGTTLHAMNKQEADQFLTNFLQQRLIINGDDTIQLGNHQYTLQQCLDGLRDVYELEFDPPRIYRRASTGEISPTLESLQLFVSGNDLVYFIELYVNNRQQLNSTFPEASELFSRIDQNPARYLENAFVDLRGNRLQYVNALIQNDINALRRTMRLPMMPTHLTASMLR